jgi:hypothetical protein
MASREPDRLPDQMRAPHLTESSAVQFAISNVAACQSDPGGLDNDDTIQTSLNPRRSWRRREWGN